MHAAGKRKRGSKHLFYLAYRLGCLPFVFRVSPDRVFIADRRTYDLSWAVQEAEMPSARRTDTPKQFRGSHLAPTPKLPSLVCI